MASVQVMHEDKFLSIVKAVRPRSVEPQQNTAPGRNREGAARAVTS
jgi:hypothetical protein